MVTKQEIEDELQNGIVILGRLIKNECLTDFLNNFHGRLFGGFQRRLIERMGSMDKKIRGENYSERARNRTHRKFYQDVDQATREVGIDEGEILEFQEYHGYEKDEEKERISRRIFPIYIALRQKGYAHYPDLTC